MSTAPNKRRYKILVFIGASIVTIGALAVNLTGVGPSGFGLFAAFAGVVSPAFLSALKSWEEVGADQDRRKSHAATWNNPSALRVKRQNFTDAIAANDLDKAKVCAAQVMDVLRVDHAAFAALR